MSRGCARRSGVPRTPELCGPWAANRHIVECTGGALGDVHSHFWRARARRGRVRPLFDCGSCPGGYVSAQSPTSVSAGGDVLSQQVVVGEYQTGLVEAAGEDARAVIDTFVALPVS